MMAVRERAVKVMAALERRVPCLDDFVGQSWSVWADRNNLTASDGEWLRFPKFFPIFGWKKSFGCGLFSRKGMASLTNFTQTKNLPGPSAGRILWFLSGPFNTHLICWVGCASSFYCWILNCFIVSKHGYAWRKNDTRLKYSRVAQYTFCTNETHVIGWTTFHTAA